MFALRSQIIKNVSYSRNLITINEIQLITLTISILSVSDRMNSSSNVNISGVLVSFMGGMTPNHLRPPEIVCQCV